MTTPAPDAICEDISFLRHTANCELFHPERAKQLNRIADLIQQQQATIERLSAAKEHPMTSNSVIDPELERIASEMVERAEGEFTKGDTFLEDGDDYWQSGIHAPNHAQVIVCYGADETKTTALRDKVLKALAALQAVPAANGEAGEMTTPDKVRALCEESAVEVLRGDADYVRRNAHATIAPYAAERIEKAAALIERLSAEKEELDKLLELAEGLTAGQRSDLLASEDGLWWSADGRTSRGMFRKGLIERPYNGPLTPLGRDLQTHLRSRATGEER